MRGIPLGQLSLGSCLRVLGVCTLIVFILWYVHFQARNFIAGPQITLEDTGGIVHTERMVQLRGNAQNITKLTLNGREIHTTETGDFTELLVLEEGYSVLTLAAQDRFGRTTSLSREFVYTSPTP